MSEESATILENTAEEPKTPENPPKNPPENSSEVPAPAQLPTPPPARKPGRPAGSKDRVPRRKIRVEPFPEPVAMTPPRAESAPPKAHPKAPLKPPPKAPAPREPSPPTPRTLYRQTSEHLVNLRSAMNDQRRMSVAERYTANLHSWMA